MIIENNEYCAFQFMILRSSDHVLCQLVKH